MAFRLYTRRPTEGSHSLAECARLESVYTETYRGFESLSLRATTYPFLRTPASLTTMLGCSSTRIWFREEAISAETRAFNTGLQEMLSRLAPTSSFEPEQVRRARREGKSWLGPVVHSQRARTITIDGPSRDLELRIIETAEPGGAYLHIHGPVQRPEAQYLALISSGERDGVTH